MGYCPKCDERFCDCREFTTVTPDNELERLAIEFVNGSPPNGYHEAPRISCFKSGFRMAEKLFKERWPSEEEINQEIAKLYFKDPESSRAKAFELGVKWMLSRLKEQMK